MGRLSLLVILLFGGIAGMSVRQLPFDDDEFQHAHMAVLLADGEIPHRDFFEHHFPLYHFALAPATLGNPGPERILLFRGLSVLIAMGTLTCLARAFRIWTGADSPVALALTAFSPVFLVKMIEVRPEGFCMLLGTACLLCLHRPERLILAGLLAGAMVGGSQKFVFLAAGFFFIAWRLHGFRNLLRFCLGGLMLPLLLLLYYLLTGAGAAAFHDLVLLNLHWQESFSPKMYATSLWNNSALLIAAGLVGAFTRGNPDTRRTVRLLLLSGLAAVLWVPIPFRQTFLMLYPGLALGAALCLQQAGDLLENRKWRMLCGTLLAGFGLLPAAAEIGRQMETGPEEDLARMEQMEERGSDPVFDGRGLLFYRPHVGHYAWMHHGLMLMLDPEEHAEQTIQALTEAGYPDVLWDYRVDLMSPTLHRFLQEHYVNENDSLLWVPGIKIDRSQLRNGVEVSLPSPGIYTADWQGGSVEINGTVREPGESVQTGSGPVSVSGTGFVRNFTLRRTGAVE